MLPLIHERKIQIVITKELTLALPQYLKVFLSPHENMQSEKYHTIPVYVTHGNKHTMHKNSGLDCVLFSRLDADAEAPQ